MNTTMPAIRRGAALGAAAFLAGMLAFGITPRNAMSPETPPTIAT